MGIRIRILRLDGRNEDGWVAPHIGGALDVTNPSDLDNRQARLHRIAVRAGAKHAGTVSSTLSRSNCIAGAGDMRPSADHECAEAVTQGG